MKDKEEFEWSVTAVTALDIGCTCRKEFQVQAKSLLHAAFKAKMKIKKDFGDAWLIRSIWWLDPNRQSGA